jgi:ABC-2 type transport system ATP-binding protein
MADIAIEFNNVTKFYKRHFWEKKVTALLNCSFYIEKNSVTGFVGPNGAGKTTSIKILLGLIYPSKGIAKINGKEPTNPASRKKISYLSERPYFYEHLSIKETLNFAYSLLDNKYASLSEYEIKKILDKVELDVSLNTKVKDLSKGMQQRLSMALALLGNGDIYILDEPMSGLDPIGRKLFKQIIMSLGQEGKTVFFSTHILDDVESICSHIVVLSKGKLEYQGKLLDLLSQNYSSIECTVKELKKEEMQYLQSIGCSIKTDIFGKTVINVNSENNLSLCQKYLIQRGVLIDSINKKIPSLEDIIYKRK